MRFLYLALLALASFTPHARAADSCYDPVPVAERTEVWDFNADPRADFYLPTRYQQGLVQTKAAAHFAWEKEGAISVNFDHYLPFGMVGLQYTVHRFEVQVGEFVFERDFTDGCTRPGASFFPGETAGAPAIKVPAHPGVAPVRIRVWGHL